MKKLLTIAILIIASSNFVFSQVQQEEIDFYQSVFGMEKKMMVASLLQIDETHDFWTTYDEYEEARKELGQRRLNLILEYGENYETLSDDKIDELAKEMMAIRKSTEALMAKYFKKVKKSFGTKMAAEFYQLECYTYAAVGAEIFSTIPLIGEFE